MSSLISTLRLGTMDNFIHFVIDNATRQTMVVDPAWDAHAIDAHLACHDLRLTGVLLTHSHGDHISALKAILARHRVPFYITESEFALGNISLNKPTFINDGEYISLGDSHIEVIETPGHTIGSTCFLLDNQLIAGDTLFIDGCGRCNFPESDVEKMWHSLQRLKTLSDDYIIYCGHDYGQKPTDTLGKQKQTNPYLLIDDKAFFIEFRNHLQAQYRSIPFEPSSLEAMQAIRQYHSK